MNILFVCSGNSDFGIIPFIKDQGESLKKNGVNLDYYTIKGLGLSGYIKNISGLKKIIDESNYNLIHAHYTFSGWTAILAHTNIPVIISYMGCDVFGYINKKGNKKFRSIINTFLSNLLLLFVKEAIVKSINLKSYLYFKKKIHIIPNGVDFNLFKPLDKNWCRKKLKLNTQKKMILFLGDPRDPRKNINLFYQSLKHVHNISIEIINPFPIKHNHVVHFLNAADLLVFTSFFEGSPNVIKEAMACNCPIVSTDVGDVKEIIKDTQGCYLCSFDPEDVAEKIILALNFNKRTNGREHIQHLEINKIAQEIIKIYTQVIKN